MTIWCDSNLRFFVFTLWLLAEVNVWFVYKPKDKENMSPQPIPKYDRVKHCLSIRNYRLHAEALSFSNSLAFHRLSSGSPIALHLPLIVLWAEL
ncbi:MAG: hypothetical protein ACREBR_02955 [bacterium]